MRRQIKTCQESVQNKTANNQKAVIIESKFIHKQIKAIQRLKMRRFTYEQCDMIHKKMNNFDSVLGKVEISNSMAGRKQQSRKVEISNSMAVRKQEWRKQSQNVGGGAMREKDFNVNRELMSNYQSGTHVGEADGRKVSVLDRERDVKMGKQNYVKGIEKMRHVGLYDDRKYEALKVPAYKQPIHKSKPTPSSIHVNESLSYSSIHPQAASCTSHILQQGYSSITHDHSSHLRQDKSQTINDLNSQIKQIMSKYDYEWGREEVRMLVEQRVTLPSFRAKETGENGIKQKSRGYIRVEESVSEERVMHGEHSKKQSNENSKKQNSKEQHKVNNKKQNNEFSPYSDHQFQNYSSAIPLSTKPMIKKQQPHNPSTQTNNNLSLTDYINPTHSYYAKNHPNKPIPMIKSQLLQQGKNQLLQQGKTQKPLNLNRGQNKPNLVRHQPNQAELESSQKKMARYMQGYDKLAARKHHRMDVDSMPKNRSELIDRSIEELNERMREVEHKKLLLLNLKPFKLDTFKSKLLNHHHGQYHTHRGLEVYPSFEIKEQERKPLQHKEEQNKKEDNCQPHIRFIVSNQKSQSPVQQSATIEKEERDNSPFPNSNSLQFPQSHCYQSLDENSCKQITVNDPCQNVNDPTVCYNANDPAACHDSAACQIDSLFNCVSLEGQTEYRSNKDGSNVEENVNQVKESVPNSIEQCQFATEDQSASTVMNLSANCNTGKTLDNKEKLAINRGSLGIVSGTNSLTIPAVKDSSFSDQEQPASFQQPPVQPKSAQKRLNRSSLLVKKPQNTKNAFELLLINLIQQIALDQQFRTYKTWFQFYCDTPNKHQHLKQLFHSKFTKTEQQLHLKQQFLNAQDKVNDDILNQEKMVLIMERDFTSIEQVFSVSSSEHDPFFTVQPTHKSINQTFHNSSVQQHFCIESLIKKYEACQSHWVKQLYKKFACQPLLGCGFASSQLDLQRKGFVQLEDLVRLINMNVGSGYRNRDLVAVWERIYQSKMQENKKILSNRSSNITKAPQIEFKYVLMSFAKRDKI